jgi:hypothetical protein
MAFIILIVLIWDAVQIHLPGGPEGKHWNLFQNSLSQTEICTQDLPDMKQECYPLSYDFR